MYQIVSAIDFSIVLLFLLSCRNVVCSPQASNFNARAALPIEGWALVAEICPDYTGSCGSTDSGFEACCPLTTLTDEFNYYNCDGTVANSYICCPDTSWDACDWAVLKLDNRCANITWSLWETSLDPICCRPGTKGVQPGPDDDFGHCVPTGMQVPQISMAILIGSGASATLPAVATFTTGADAIAPRATEAKRSKNVAVIREAN